MDNMFSPDKSISNIFPAVIAFIISAVPVSGDEKNFATDAVMVIW